jgi:hypothetical protein
MCETRAGILSGLQRLVSNLDADAMSAEQAKELVSWFSRIEHLAAAGKTLSAGRAAQTGILREAGHKNAASWLANETGDSLGGALRLLETAEQLRQLPVLEGAVRSGELSPTQSFLAAGAATADPSKQEELLGHARTGSLRRLRFEAERVRAASRSEEEAEARYEAVRARRSLRWWTGEDGSFRLEGRFSPDAGARLVAEIEPVAKKLFRKARHEQVHEPFCASVADALVELVTGSKEPGRSKTSYSAIVRVDLAALRRGELDEGEVCEIPGVGPVPVSVARRLLGDAFLKLVVTDGIDVQSVCHAGRHVSAFIDTALEERDRCCVVPGCDATAFLERDHWQESFAEGGPTDLVNLCRICSRHHHLKHEKGFVLRGGPGKWEWIAPKDKEALGDEAAPPPPWRAPAGAC